MFNFCSCLISLAVLDSAFLASSLIFPILLMLHCRSFSLTFASVSFAISIVDSDEETVLRFVGIGVQQQ